jgi:hypothetical protein
MPLASKMKVLTSASAPVLGLTGLVYTDGKRDRPPQPQGLILTGPARPRARAWAPLSIPFLLKMIFISTLDNREPYIKPYGFKANDELIDHSN